jgi:ribosome modulation factor
MPQQTRIDPIETGSKVHRDLTGGTGAPGHNSMLDRDTFLFLRGQLHKADDAVAEARDHRKKIRQHMENMDVVLEDFDAVEDLSEVESETALARMKRQMQYAAWLNLPIGRQVSFFDMPSADAPKQETLLEKAYLEGYKLGVEGINADEQKWQPMSDEGREHLRGWTDGQAVNLRKFETFNEEFQKSQQAKENEKAEKEQAKQKKLEEKAGKAKEKAESAKATADALAAEVSAKQPDRATPAIPEGLQRH